MDRQKIDHALVFIRHLEKQEGEKKMTRLAAFKFTVQFHGLESEEKRILGNMLQIPSCER